MSSLLTLVQSGRRAQEGLCESLGPEAREDPMRQNQERLLIMPYPEKGDRMCFINAREVT